MQKIILNLKVKKNIESKSKEEISQIVESFNSIPKPVLI